MRCRVRRLKRRAAAIAGRETVLDQRIRRLVRRPDHVRRPIRHAGRADRRDDRSGRIGARRLRADPQVGSLRVPDAQDACRFVVGPSRRIEIRPAGEQRAIGRDFDRREGELQDLRGVRICGRVGDLGRRVADGRHHRGGTGHVALIVGRPLRHRPHAPHEVADVVSIPVCEPDVVDGGAVDDLALRARADHVGRPVQRAVGLVPRGRIAGELVIQRVDRAVSRGVAAHDVAEHDLFVDRHRAEVGLPELGLDPGDQRGRVGAPVRVVLRMPHQVIGGLHRNVLVVIGQVRLHADILEVIRPDVVLHRVGEQPVERDGPRGPVRRDRAQVQPNQLIEQSDGLDDVRRVVLARHIGLRVDPERPWGLGRVARPDVARQRVRGIDGRIAVAAVSGGLVQMDQAEPELTDLVRLDVPGRIVRPGAVVLEAVSATRRIRDAGPRPVGRGHAVGKMVIRHRPGQRHDARVSGIGVVARGPTR